MLRAVNASFARSVPLVPTLARPLVRSPVSSLVPAPSARLLSTSATLHLPPRLSSSAGSGQGGKKEKEAARKEKERAQKEKEKERARKQREKDAAAKDKERARKEREKAKKLKEKERSQRDKEKEKRDKEREKEKKEKEREKERKERERAKAKAVKSANRTRSKLSPPKMPQNPWMLFLDDFINEKKASLAPGEKISVSAMSHEAGPLYHALDSAAKEQLKARFDEQKREYPAILDAWKATLTPEMIREENVVRANRRRLGLSIKKGLKIEGEPKRPITGYLRFSNEIREKGPFSDVLNGETNILEQSKLIAAAWRELAPEEQKVYNDAYAADKERYEREKAEWEADLKSKTASSTA
ncbi:hypothetical protein JCM10207_004650 [Rhodosporidiobolus poonsookiae]